MIDLAKHFGKVRALDGVTFGVAHKQCFGLLGAFHSLSMAFLFATYKVMNVCVVSYLGFTWITVLYLFPNKRILFAGANGAGKTTTFDMITRRTFPTHGRVDPDDCVSGRDRILIGHWY